MLIGKKSKVLDFAQVLLDFQNKFPRFSDDIQVMITYYNNDVRFLRQHITTKLSFSLVEYKSKVIKLLEGNLSFISVLLFILAISMNLYTFMSTMTQSDFFKNLPFDMKSLSVNPYFAVFFPIVNGVALYFLYSRTKNLGFD